MDYLEYYHTLGDIFDLSAEVIQIPDSDVIIRNFNFISERAIEESWPPETIEKNVIPQNFEFRYPVIIPHAGSTYKKAIFYLHGLNERNWLKHLPGAMLLAEQTGNPVILFPLSYHINRGLPEWTDIHKMSGPLEVRRQTYDHLKNASVVNVSLSERLTEKPLRFFASGYQSARDLLKLKRIISEGSHPLFQKGTGVDIFAYSISCMMMQVLILGYPEDFRPDTKIAFFAGGSLFCHMNGVSKYIMDSVAFDGIWLYYKEMLSKTGDSAELRSWFEKNRFGRAFTWMLGYGQFDKVREKSFESWFPNLFVIALKNDTVIPLNGIRLAFGDKFSHSGNFHVLDFPYPYIHENPFPVLNRKIEHEVDQSFRSVFEPVAEFFNAFRPNISRSRKIDEKTASFAR